MKIVTCASQNYDDDDDVQMVINQSLTKCAHSEMAGACPENTNKGTRACGAHVGTLLIKELLELLLLLL